MVGRAVAREVVLWAGAEGKEGMCPGNAHEGKHSLCSSVHCPIPGALAQAWPRESMN